MIVAGGVLMATGVGGPIGMALVGAGLDTIIQKATTGSVNWGQVALTGVVGIVAGPLAGKIGGAVASGASGAAGNTGMYFVTNPQKDWSLLTDLPFSSRDYYRASLIGQLWTKEDHASRSAKFSS